MTIASASPAPAQPVPPGLLQPIRERHPQLTSIVSALILVVYFLGILGHSFWAENEAYYALGANSVRAGHFLLPTFSEGLPIDKPPLVCWSIALLSWPIGSATEITARLANIIPAFAVLWLIFRFAAQYVSRQAGILSALILATSYEFWENSLEASTDLTLLAFLILCWCNIFAILQGGFTWRRWLLVWIPMGLGVLTKGPVAVALSGLIGCVYAIAQYGTSDGIRRLFRLRPFGGLMLCLLPITAWCAAVYFVHGWGPLKDIIYRQNVTRFVHAFNHVKPWWYLIKEYPMNLLPWTALLPLVFVQWISRKRRGIAHGDWRTFCATCNVVVLVFFSLSSAKRDYYLLPLMPWAAVLLADCLDPEGQIAEHSRSHRQTWGIIAGITLLMMLGAYAVIAFPRLETRRSVIPFVRKAEQLSSPDNPLVYFGNEDPRIFYYLNRKVIFCEDTAAGYQSLRQIIAAHPKVDILYDSDVQETITNEARVPLYPLGSEKIRNKTYYIVTTRQSPDAAN